MSERFSVQRAAEYLGTCPSVVYALVAAWAIPHYRIGLPGKRGRIVLLQEDCDAYLRAKRVEVTGPMAVAVPERKPVRVKPKLALRHLDLPS